MFDYTGKNVMVFGGTSGINLGIAHAFARAGARLGVASRNPDKVQAAKDALSAYGEPAQGYSLDVREFVPVQDAIADFAGRHGPIDVLVSGAAGNFLAAAATLSSGGFKAVTDIDTLGTFHVCRAAYAHLAKPGAVVLNISAPQAFRASPMQIHVCAAKAGVDMITRVLALEWGRDGIRVNSVTPGPIDGTEGMDRLAPTPEDKARAARNVPLGRMGTVDDVADVCLFLGSDMARYVSGAIIPVDGGSTAGRSMGAQES